MGKWNEATTRLGKQSSERREEARKHEIEDQKARAASLQEEVILSANLISLEILLRECDETSSPCGETVLVAEVCFGASPGGGDYRSYELEVDEAGEEWTLWTSILDEWTPAYEEWSSQDQDDDEELLPQPRLYSKQAVAKSVSGANPKVVASGILKACWAQEPLEWDTDLDQLSVDQEGILSRDDLFEIRDGLT